MPSILNKTFKDILDTMRITAFHKYQFDYDGAMRSQSFMDGGELALKLLYAELNDALVNAEKRGYATGYNIGLISEEPQS